MKKDFLSGLHRSTITMALVIIVLCIIILPWSNPSSAAFIPLALSIVTSAFTLIWASLSLRKQIKKEMLNSKISDEDDFSNTSV
ncbi:hypothetical protein [Caldicoprobacter faecalis]|uniref:Uncharacterized protein n=1 Tax=Caldicoprobacter faecalis TaxID=937334 RepID=A0A1I5V3K6_9FIRM|nr:hypothetical protein [Caldicoprobacter faecalis]SFQ01556.1 hypothetical protein SAMN05444406_10960 [Caldicoprobacter faecalis]